MMAGLHTRRPASPRSCGSGPPVSGGRPRSAFTPQARRWSRGDPDAAPVAPGSPPARGSARRTLRRTGQRRGAPAGAGVIPTSTSAIRHRVPRRCGDGPEDEAWLHSTIDGSAGAGICPSPVMQSRCGCGGPQVRGWAGSAARSVPNGHGGPAGAGVRRPDGATANHRGGRPAGAGMGRGGATGRTGNRCGPAGAGMNPSRSARPAGRRPRRCGHAPRQAISWTGRDPAAPQVRE